LSESKPHEIPELAEQQLEGGAESAPAKTTAEEAPAEAVQPAEETPESEAAEPEAAAEETPAENAPAEPGGEEAEPLPVVIPSDDERLALLEAIIYVSEEPLTAEQICGGLALPREVVEADLTRLVESYTGAQRGVEVRKVAGGYKMYTKAEHHEAVRGFVKSLQAKLKLSKPAFETLAVIAYKQPITVPEIQAIRGVNASGTIHTLLKHKLITSAGRKKVIGKPMMYKTTREFLVQFGLDDLGELPNLKEFEELSRAALGDEEPVEAPEEAAAQEPEAEGQAEPEAEGQAEPEAELAAIEDEAADRMEAEPEAEEEPAEEKG
jgi:segregation and condensation protein B